MLIQTATYICAMCMLSYYPAAEYRRVILDKGKYRTSCSSNHGLSKSLMIRSWRRGCSPPRTVRSQSYRPLWEYSPTVSPMSNVYNDNNISILVSFEKKIRTEVYMIWTENVAFALMCLCIVVRGDYNRISCPLQWRHISTCQKGIHWISLGNRRIILLPKPVFWELREKNNQ